MMRKLVDPYTAYEETTFFLGNRNAEGPLRIDCNFWVYLSVIVLQSTSILPYARRALLDLVMHVRQLLL